MNNSRPIAGVLQALERLGHAAKSAAGGWSARCPAHDDRVASLSVAGGDDDRVLLRCHAGCTVEAITSALGLEMSDLFVAEMRQGNREAAYEIRDVDGHVRAVHVRIDRPDGSKTVIWRRPDGASGLGGARVADLPLYGAERMREWREDEPILLVEGEKACDALTEVGFQALGTVTGAASCPSLDSFAPLRGRSVVLWPDNDPAGREHMRKVARGLMFAVGSVRVFEWSGGGRGCDAFDFLRQGPDAAHQLRSDLTSAVPAIEWLSVRSSTDDGSPESVVAKTLGSLPEQPTRGTLIQALQELGSLAIGLNPTMKVAVRFEAIDLLKSLKVAPEEARRLVSAELGKEDEEGGGRPRNDQGTALNLGEIERWSESVDGAELLDELTRTFERFVSLPPGAAETLALFVVHAHAHDTSDISPILALVSPVKRCGKTTTLHLLQGLVPKALHAANITSAALFRAVERFAPTLLVDEADTFLHGRDDLIGVLNSGHARASAHVVRTVGENFEPRLFSTWAPKAIALIGRLPATLEDRSIVIVLQRRRHEHRGDRLRLDRLGDFEEVRRKAARFAFDSMDALRQADPLVPDGLNDRAADNWRPLLAIADAAGGSWPQVARGCALSSSGAAVEGESAPGIQLLGDVARIFKDEGVDRLASAEIVAALAEMEDRAWPEWRNGRAITPTQLARLLRLFDIRPRKVRIGSGTQQGYVLDDFREPLGRYLPSEVEQPEHPKRDNDLAASESRNTPIHVPGPVPTVTPCEIRLVPGVPPRGVSYGRGVVCHIASGR